MNRSVLPPPVRERGIAVSVGFGPDDVERAAESLHVTVSDQEVEAIVADIDGELAGLASTATRSAIAARIYDDLRRVARGHTWSDDD